MKMTSIVVGMLETNCYLLQSESGNCAVIDPGANPDQIIELMEQDNLCPKFILLTHGHHDHIGGVKKLLERYPDAELYIGAADVELLSQPNSRSGGIEAVVKTLSDGDELIIDELVIRVIHTPGHTKGGVVFLCNDQMFSGDTLFFHDCGRCDLYGGDYEVMKQSLKKLAQLEGNYKVYPGHGDSSTLAEERQHNPYMIEGCGLSE